MNLQEEEKHYKYITSTQRLFFPLCDGSCRMGTWNGLVNEGDAPIFQKVHKELFEYGVENKIPMLVTYFSGKGVTFTVHILFFPFSNRYNCSMGQGQHKDGYGVCFNWTFHELKMLDTNTDYVFIHCKKEDANYG